jgi:hypothetical protein
MRDMSPRRILLAGAVAGALVLAGVGIGMAVSDRESAPDAVNAGQAERPRSGPSGGGRAALRTRERPHARRAFLLRPGARLAGRPDPDVREVVRQIRLMLAAEAPDVADKVVADAVEDGRITIRQGQRVRQRVERFSELARKRAERSRR